MLFRWQPGRQGGNYTKLLLIPAFVSKLLCVDVYLIKIPKNEEIKKHTDPVVQGYKHYRLNIKLVGSKNDVMHVDGPIKRIGRIDYFRPDLYEHWLDKTTEDIYLLSFGWLLRHKK